MFAKSSVIAKLSLVLLFISTTECLPLIAPLNSIPLVYAEIRSILSNKCIGPASGSTGDGVQITQQTCSGDTSQAWKFTPTDGNQITCVNLKSGLCLGVSGTSKINSAPLVQSACRNEANQRFVATSVSRVNAIWKIIAVSSGLSLDVPRSEKKDGTPIQQYTYKTSNSPNQQWQFVPWTKSTISLLTGVVQISTIVYDKCIGPLRGAMAEGSAITIQTCGPDRSQSWKFVALDADLHLIVNVENALCLSVAGSSTAKKATFIQSTCRAAANQKFQLTDTVGFWKLVAHISGLSLDLPAYQTADGTRVQQYPFNAGTNQKWLLLPVPTPQPVPDADTQIANLASSLCVGPAAGTPAEGAQLTLQACCGDPSQAWRFVRDGAAGNYTVVNRRSGLCLQAAAGGFTQGRCRRAASQKVQLAVVSGVWTALAAGSGLALDGAAAGAGGAAAPPLLQRASAASPTQRWRLLPWPPLAPMPTAAVQIVGGASGKCVGPMSGMAHPGAEVTLQTCRGDPAQAWLFLPRDCGRYALASAHSGLCLAAPAPAADAGALVAQAACDPADPAQLWSPTPAGDGGGGAFNLASAGSGLFLDVLFRETNEGALLAPAAFSARPSQDWRHAPWAPVPPVPPRFVQIRGAASGLCVAAATPGAAAWAPVALAPCAAGGGQLWQLRLVGPGLYIVVGLQSGRCLAVAGASADDGAGAALVECQKPSGPTEQWVPARAGDSDGWTLTAAHSGLALAVRGGSAAAGAQAVQANCGGAACPRWRLVDTPRPAGPAAAWTAPAALPLVAIAAALMGDGRVTFWSSSQLEAYGTGQLQTYSAAYDPATGRVSQELLTSIQSDAFCPATALLADGALLVAGGVTSGATNIFDGAAWARGPRLNIPRGYNAATLTADGSVLTLGGSWSGGFGGKLGELWTALDGWRVLPGVLMDSLLTDDMGGIFRRDNHMWLIAAGAGWVFHAGPSRAMHWIRLAGAGAVLPAGRRGDDKDAMNGNAVVYAPHLIVTLGGAPSYERGTTSSAVFIIDISAGPDKAPTVRRAKGQLTFPRALHNSVVLPTGEVVVVGGQTGKTKLFSDAEAVLVPELWDPSTETFTLLPPLTIPRTYHSVALLLPDGRVLSAGGGSCGAGCVANHLDFEILTPPYLLNHDGSSATRPTLSSAPETVAPGATMVVRAAGAASFAVVRMSSVTHALNCDQRRIPLAATKRSNGSYALEVPDVDVTLPGNYMLFALGPTGTPSVASIVRVTLPPA